MNNTYNKSIDKEVEQFCDELIQKHRKPYLLLKNVYAHALITLEFLIEASNGGYDYDATFEIPLYEACKEVLTEKYNKHK